jgi:hypothetical protein
MFGSTRAAAADAKPENKPAPGKTMLEARRATRDNLPKRLLLKSDGRPCVPVQLSFTDARSMTPESIAQMTTYLRARQRAGGHERVLQANTQAATEDVLHALDAQVAESGDMPVKQLLDSIRQAALDEKRAIDARAGELRERYNRAEQNLFKYQESAGTSSSGKPSIWQRMFGSAISIADAAQAFNEREAIGIDMDALAAAADMLARLIGDCDLMQRSLESVVTTAQAEAAKAAARAAQIEAEMPVAQADFTVNTHKVAQALVNPAQHAPRVAELVRFVREHGAEGLAERAAGMAQQDIAAQLDGADVMHMVELEAKHTFIDDAPIDPRAARAVAAETLLHMIDQRPGVLLSNTAGSREFAAQVSQKGHPLFERAPFIHAEYRGEANVAAFMHIDAGIALDELLTLQEGKARFEDALTRREFFVLEDVIDEWNDTHETDPMLDDDRLIIRGLSPNGRAAPGEAHA